MRILVIDDHAIVRTGLRRLLSTLPAAEIAEAETGREALAQYREGRFDIIVLDLNLPGLGGFELVKRLLLLDKNARILIFSMNANATYAARGLQAGALGYMSKNAAPDELLVAVRRVAEGGRYIESSLAVEIAVNPSAAKGTLNQLNDRDLEILRMLGTGRSLSEIAQALGVGYKTIANTCSQLKVKLGVNRTADLIRLSVEMKLSQEQGDGVAPNPASL